MRFINGQASEPALFEQDEDFRPEKGFRRDVEELYVALADTTGDRRVLLDGTMWFRQAAGTPTATSWLTWSCINATRGETTTVKPSNRSAGKLVAE